MGRRLDLSGLTDQEAEHVLKVVQRDMRLRQTEEERLSEMKQDLAEEGSRCSLLSKQQLFNQHCCIRCCAPFTFLLNPRRRCLDCQYNVCKGCRTYCQRDGAWLCSACQKGRVLRTRSLEWYYNNVKSRFKSFGSAKVLKTLYRKHIDERGSLSLSDLRESSVQEGSNDNDDSVCGSDSAFYKQSEGHSMADTLTVALRVAEEAIEEAISKAEEFSDSLEKQNEARYLRDHKEDLIEELATTIVHKVGLGYDIFRSRSAFSLTSDDSPQKGPEDQTGVGGFPEYASLKREAKATALPSWKSVDRLDNSSASSVLQSPDGNWMALQSSQLSRPSLLTKRKSLVFSALEKESGVVSAYDEMGSESLSQDQPGPGAPPSPLSPPGPPGAPEEGFFNSEAAEKDPDTLAPHLTPGSLGAREGGPRRPQLGPQPGPQAARRSPNDTWGPSSSEDERVRRPPDRAMDGDGAAPGEREEEERAKHGTAEKRRRQTASDPTPDSSRTPGPQQQFSAASLCSITTEVLKVLNATEDLIGEAGRVDSFTTPSESMSASPISSCSDTSRLENRLTKMEQNVYLAASAVYGLEGALGDLEECARSISSGTTDTELAFLEDQVATAAAQVQQSELQISNIEARISALKTAGLNVTACNRFSKYKPKVSFSSDPIQCFRNTSGRQC
uniref:RabBD domain-containing protein n=1 Tax=Gadus morhua TaxID=8049 RepID=A0A8C5CIB0_GADMO